MTSRPPQSSRTPLAGGAVIAVGSILGAGVGLFSAIGPTRGFLVGLTLGVAISLVMWLIDLRK